MLTRSKLGVHQSVCTGEANLLLSMAMLASCTGICPAAAALDHDGDCCIWADCVAVDAVFAPSASNKCSRCALSTASCCFLLTLSQCTSLSNRGLGTCKELDTSFVKGNNAVLKENSPILIYLFLYFFLCLHVDFQVFEGT